MDTRLAVDVEEAARRLSVPERTIWALLAADRLHSFKLGRRRLIRVADLEAFVDSQAAGPKRVTRPTSAARRVPRSAATSNSDETGIVMPFVELPGGGVTTRTASRSRPKAARR